MDVDTSGGSLCPFCPDVAFDALSDHAAPCRHGGDVIAQHNHLRDIFADFCCHAHLPVKAEVGYGLGRDNVNSRPADVLVQGLDRGKPTSLLHRHSLLSPSVKLVWHLEQQHLQLNPGSMLPMLLRARSGHAFYLPSRHMAIGGRGSECVLLPSLSACNQPGQPQIQK